MKALLLDIMQLNSRSCKHWFEGVLSPIERDDWLSLDLCVDDFHQKIKTAGGRPSMAA